MKFSHPRTLPQGPVWTTEEYLVHRSNAWVEKLLFPDLVAGLFLLLAGLWLSSLLWFSGTALMFLCYRVVPPQKHWQEKRILLVCAAVAIIYFCLYFTTHHYTPPEPENSRQQIPAAQELPASNETDPLVPIQDQISRFYKIPMEKEEWEPYISRLLSEGWDQNVVLAKGEFQAENRQGHRIRVKLFQGLCSIAIEK